MTKIKICGLRREADVGYANECMPDYVGFVFAKSARQVTRRQASRLKELLDPGIGAVGVFVNEPVSQVAKLLNEEIIDLAQLHGDETEEYIQRLRGAMNRGELMKAVRVRDAEDIRRGEKLSVEYLLLDAFSQKAYGGTGNTFDWEMAKGIKKPFFLAGGISTQNVGEAIMRLAPFGVDVSSFVETDGYKDPEKMARFVELARSCRGKCESC